MIDHPVAAERVEKITSRATADIRQWADTLKVVEDPVSSTSIAIVIAPINCTRVAAGRVDFQGNC